MATITSPRPQSPAGTSRNAIQSPTLTPSSSVRPSFDLPANTNGRASSPAPGPAGAPAQRRNRAALRDYYHLKSKPSSAQPQPPGPPSRTASIASIGSESTLTSATDALPPPSASLPPQLDDPDFDAAAYVRQLLQTEPLRGLLKVEGGLVSEIKQLDGERKALVYDNYSKLIVATRTIGRMQRTLNSDADGAGGLKSMERLRPAVEGIAVVAAELGRGAEKGPAAGPGRAERKSAREKKQLVRWVVEAPGRFERLLRDGKEDAVVAEWEAVQELLEKWKGVKGVDEVRQACEKVVAGIEHAEEDGD